MMNKISNLRELQVEIARLEQTKREQEGYLGEQVHLLKEKISAPVRFVQHLTSFMPSGASLFGKIGSSKGFQEDWLTKGLRVGLPVLINRLFFRKAGYVKRLIMGLLSNQAAGFLNKDRLAQGIDALTSWIRKPKGEKKKKPSQVMVDQINTSEAVGIPPDSETY